MPRPRTASGLARPLLAAHGLFYAATGVWPVLHRRSFERVTGPKTDFWLVRTVGALLTVVGASMLTAAARRQPAAEMAVLAVGSAAALAAVDVRYAAAGRISKVYLLDAVAEVALAAAWLAVLRRGCTAYAAADLPPPSA